MPWLKRKKSVSRLLLKRQLVAVVVVCVLLNVDTLLESVQAAQRDAEMWFGDDTVYMERFLQNLAMSKFKFWVMVMATRFIYMTVTVHYNVVTKSVRRSSCAKSTGTSTC